MGGDFYKCWGCINEAASNFLKKICLLLESQALGVSCPGILVVPVWPITLEASDEIHRKNHFFVNDNPRCRSRNWFYGDRSPLTGLECKTTAIFSTILNWQILPKIRNLMPLLFMSGVLRNLAQLENKRCFIKLTDQILTLRQ